MPSFIEDALIKFYWNFLLSDAELVQCAVRLMRIINSLHQSPLCELLVYVIFVSKDNLRERWKLLPLLTFLVSWRVSLKTPSFSFFLSIGVATLCETDIYFMPKKTSLGHRYFVISQIDASAISDLHSSNMLLMY